PKPGQVVDCYVQMPERWDTLTAAAPKTGKMRTFSTRYWIWVKPRASGPGSAGSTISLGGGSFSTAKYGVGPRTSLALWAKALVASTVPALTAASVLMSRVIAFSPLHRAGRAFIWMVLVTVCSLGLLIHVARPRFQGAVCQKARISARRTLIY